MLTDQQALDELVKVFLDDFEQDPVGLADWMARDGVDINELVAFCRDRKFLKAGKKLERPQREIDIDVLARTIYGEARGESYKGKIAVGWAIRNRVDMDLHGDGKPDWWGEGYEGVCKKTWQFTCWHPSDPNYVKVVRVQVGDKVFNECLQVAAVVIAGMEDDPTMGSTHYHTTNIKKWPGWASKSRRGVVKVIGLHAFYNDIP